jgi:hypothetical protein
MWYRPYRRPGRRRGRRWQACWMRGVAGVGGRAVGAVGGELCGGGRGPGAARQGRAPRVVPVDRCAAAHRGRRGPARGGTGLRDGRGGTGAGHPDVAVRAADRGGPDAYPDRPGGMARRRIDRRRSGDDHLADRRAGWTGGIVRQHEPLPRTLYGRGGRGARLRGVAGALTSGAQPVAGRSGRCRLRDRVGAVQGGAGFVLGSHGGGRGGVGGRRLPARAVVIPRRGPGRPAGDGDRGQPGGRDGRGDRGVRRGIPVRLAGIDPGGSGGRRRGMGRDRALPAYRGGGRGCGAGLTSASPQGPAAHAGRSWARS